jgi:UDP-glucose 4-epimerase
VFNLGNGLGFSVQQVIDTAEQIVAHAWGWELQYPWHRP